MSPPALAASALPLDAADTPRWTTAAARPMFFGEVPVTETEHFPPADAPHCWVYVTLNAEIALDLPQSAGLQTLLQQPRTRVSVDGQWLWWALRRKYPQQPLRKFSGSDLIYELAARCAADGRRLLLLGSTPQTNGAAVMRLRERFPGLAVAGFAPPRIELGSAATPDMAQAVQESLAAIAAWRADFVVLGLGAAKEHALAGQIAPGLDGRVTGLLCFGGAIDMASGEVRRAPAWLQRLGLEGPWRVWQQPVRLWRFLRVLRVLPRLALQRY